MWILGRDRMLAGYVHLDRPDRMGRSADIVSADANTLQVTVSLQGGVVSEPWH
jgi:hypothetical protein